MSFIGNAARLTYQLAFEYSPILLQGGNYKNTPGGYYPIIGLYGQLAAFGQGALTNGFSTANFFARYYPLPGGTTVNFKYSEYPYANQQIAANSAVKQALEISLLMIAPVNAKAGYLTKTLLMQSFITSLQNHVLAGGYFTILTPGYIYENCLLKGKTDVTPENDKQKQIMYQLDFYCPIITEGQTETTPNKVIKFLSSGASFKSPT